MLSPENSSLVAGAGVEPTSGDYEPPEIPFLHPALIEEFYQKLDL